MSTIRPARIEDCDAIAAMVQALAETSGVTAGTTGETLRREAFGERPTLEILVAEDGTGLLGFLIHQDTFSSWRGANGVFVTDFFVKSDLRGQGIGLALMREAARLGRTRGARFMRLDVERGNSAGLRFYERLGFRDIDHLFRALDEPGFVRLGDAG